MTVAKGEDRKKSAEALVAAGVAPDVRLVVAPGFTPAMRAQFVYHIGAGNSRSRAAEKVDVSWSTVSAALDSDLGFRNAVETAEVKKWQLAEDKLYEALEEGQPWAVKLVVKEAAHLRDRWKPSADRLEVEMEMGPAAERIMELAATLEQRKMELATGSLEPVLDVESEETNGFPV